MVCFINSPSSEYKFTVTLFIPRSSASCIPLKLLSLKTLLFILALWNATLISSLLSPDNNIYDFVKLSLSIMLVIESSVVGTYAFFKSTNFSLYLPGLRLLK